MKVADRLRLAGPANLGIPMPRYRIHYLRIWLATLVGMHCPVMAGPRVWVISDMSRPGSGADKDDLVTMSGFLLMANRFDIVGMTVGADSRSLADCGDAASWANANFKTAYAAEVGNLNKAISGFPPRINFMQSAWCGAQYSATGKFNIDDAGFAATKALAAAAETGPLTILNWGELTDAAYLIKYLADNKPAVLGNVSIISHWTYPFGESNCKNSATGCSYLHDLAKSGGIKFYELGPIGQTGLVDNSCNGNATLGKSIMSASKIGAYMNWKWTGSGAPDMSDGAAFLVLAGYGGGLAAYRHDGTYDAAGEARLCKDRGAIFKVWEIAAKAAVTGAGTTSMQVHASSAQTESKQSQSLFRVDGVEVLSGVRGGGGADADAAPGAGRPYFGIRVPQE